MSDDPLSHWRSATAIEAWWASSTQDKVRRDYTAADVQALRDVYPEMNNGPALKLRRILSKHKAAGSINMASSAMDATSMQMMREAGLETAYVSGGMASMTETPTMDPSTDQADYPYDTVPKRVETLHRSQLLHIRAAKPKLDNAEDGIIPLIADADSGHGLHTAIMKLVKLFVQAGTAGIHIDDLLSGAKRFDGRDGVGYILVPLNEHVRRIKAAKLMLDVLGSEMVLIGRHDGNSATHITSTIDPRDRPFILGTTERSPAAISRGALTTLDEAFQRAHPDLFTKFAAASQDRNVAESVDIARNMAPAFYWSCESPRTVEGWYAYRGGSEAAISRALVVAPLVDVSWACMGSYDSQQAQEFAEAIQGAYPGKWMAYNFTGAFGANVSSDKEIAQIPQTLANLGYVWQFLPVAGMTAIGVGTKPIFEAIKRDGVLGYLQTASRPAAGGSSPSVEWWWKGMGVLSDSAADAIGTGM